MRAGFMWRALALLTAATLATPVAAWASVPPCPVVPIPTLRLPATKAAVARGRHVVIVAFGSSSTEGAGASSPSLSYPARLLVLLRNAWPGVPVTVLNRGQGGQTTVEMLQRLDRDVMMPAPTLVIWQSGGNAALRDLDPVEFGTLTHQGVTTILAGGADLVLMDNQVAPRIERMPRHALYGEVLAREAEASGISLFSRTALMRRWAASDPSGLPMIGPDGLHHTDRGYACLAEAMARAIVASTVSPNAIGPRTAKASPRRQ